MHLNVWMWDNHWKYDPLIRDYSSKNWYFLSSISHKFLITHQVVVGGCVLPLFIPTWWLPWTLQVLHRQSHLLCLLFCPGDTVCPQYSINFWLLLSFCIFSQDDPWVFVQAYDKHAPLMVSLLSVLCLVVASIYCTKIRWQDLSAAWICGNRDKYWENNWDYVISNVIVIVSLIGNMSSLVTDSPPDLQQLTWVLFCGAG